MVSITVFVICSIIMFGLGMLAGRAQGKEICIKKVNALLEQWGFKYNDENNGDA